MARTGFFESIFADMTAAEAIVREAWLKQLEDEEKAACLAAQRLVDYYNRDRAAIVKYLTEAARKTFGNQVNDWQWPLINGVPRIMKRLSLAYMQPPERKLARGGEALDLTAKEYDLIFGEDGLYSAIDIDRKLKEADRYSTLLNTVHIEVVPRKGKIGWDIRLRPATMVVPDPDDYLEFLKFAYEFNPMHADTLRPRNGWVYWTADRHVYRMANGEEVGMSVEDGSNPYAGVIPIVTVRKIEQDDYWGCFGGDLVDGFEQALLQLGNLWETSFMQTHGQPFGVNLGLAKGETLVTGPKNPVLVNNVGRDDVTPSLSFVSPEAKIQEVRELIDWYVNACGLSYGLPPGSWSMDETPESGFSKFMNNIELFEDRADAQSMWIQIEQKLFDTSRMVWNRWAPENGAKRIPEDLELQVIFQPVKMPESPTDKASRYVVGIKAGITSAVRYFMDEEGLDREAAIAKAREIDEENKMFNEAPSAENFLTSYLQGKVEPKETVPPEEEE